MNTIRVVRVVTEADMRRTRALAFDDYRIFDKLKHGEAVLLINRAQNVARFIDAERILHTCYAKPGEVYDLDRIFELLNNRTLCLNMRLQRSNMAAIGRHSGLSSPTKVVVKKRKRKAA